MTAILTTALIVATATLALFVLVRDSSHLLAKHGEWHEKLARIGHSALRDPVAFTLRPACDAKRGVPARPSSPRRRRAAA